MLAVCIATGPSLTQSDVDLCRKADRVFAVKEAAVMAPWAHVLYAADEDWWQLKKGCPGFAGEKWTCSEQAALDFDLNHIEIDIGAVWGTNGVIASGGHSGFQAMNLAYLQGATKIILLGYDLGFTTQKHWYDKTPGLKRISRWSNYDDWLRRMKQAAPLIDIPVLNASRQSAITCFPKVNIEDVL